MLSFLHLQASRRDERLRSNYSVPSHQSFRGNHRLEVTDLAFLCGVIALRFVTGVLAVDDFVNILSSNMDAFSFCYLILPGVGSNMNYLFPNLHVFRGILFAGNIMTQPSFRSTAFVCFGWLF